MPQPLPPPAHDSGELSRSVLSNRSVWDRISFAKIGSWLKRDEGPPPPPHSKDNGWLGSGHRGPSDFLRGTPSRKVVPGLPRPLTFKRMEVQNKPIGGGEHSNLPLGSRQVDYGIDTSPFDTILPESDTPQAQLVHNPRLSSTGLVSPRTLGPPRPSTPTPTLASLLVPVNPPASSYASIGQGDVPSLDQAAHILYKPLEAIIRACGWQGNHRIFNDARDVPLAFVRSLGHGSLGVVDEVSIDPESKNTFVRKRVRVPYLNRVQRLRIIKQEAAALIKLIHPHIVKIIGSYEDGPPNAMFYSLLMYPAGDNDLKNFLEILGEQQINQNEFPSDAPVTQKREWLWSWFGCLAGALTYMHRSGIRHQDIKSSNIVHRGRIIYFTDFSSADEFKVDHTTSTESPACATDMYRAPEVSQPGERHGLRSDIFSLGCVFLEMLTVMCHTTVANFQEFCCKGDVKPSRRPGALTYRNSLGRIREWFSQHEDFQEIYEEIELMLEPKRENRPSAPEVLGSMLEMTHMGIEINCCCHAVEGHINVERWDGVQGGLVSGDSYQLGQVMRPELE